MSWEKFGLFKYNLNKIIYVFNNNNNNKRERIMGGKQELSDWFQFSLE